MKRMQQYPCTNCRKVEHPQQCDNKECKLWRAWFLWRWEQLRRQYLPNAAPCSQKRTGEKQWEEGK